MSVRGSLCDHLGGHVGGRAWPGLDDEGLSEPLRQPLPQKPRENVTAATWRKPDNDAHRPQRIALRPSQTRVGRQRDRTRCETQKLPPCQFHCGALFELAEPTAVASL